MTPEDRAKARREIVRVLRNLSTYHTDEDAADLILYALDCLAALAAEPKPVEITHEMNECAAEAAWQAWPNGIDDPSWAGLRIAVRAALAAALREARTEGGESQ